MYSSFIAKWDNSTTIISISTSSYGSKSWSVCIHFSLPPQVDLLELYFVEPVHFTVLFYNSSLVSALPFHFPIFPFSHFLVHTQSSPGAESMFWTNFLYVKRSSLIRETISYYVIHFRMAKAHECPFAAMYIYGCKRRGMKGSSSRFFRFSDTPNLMIL